MKTTFFLPFLFMSYLAVAVQVNKTMPETQAGFIENKGQIHDQHHKPNSKVLYLLNTSGLNVQIKKTGFAYDTYIIEKKVKQVDQLVKKNQPEILTKQDSIEYTYKFHRIDIELVGANPQAQMIAEQPSADYTNYYNVTYAEEGILNVRSFQKVIAKNIYAGIDVEYLIENGTFKYNFIVHPGADYKQIKLRYAGAPMELINNSIRFKLAQGLMEEHIPKSWYEKADVKSEPVEVSYRLLTENVFGFDGVDVVDEKILVIDPTPDRLWGTYFGGTGNEQYEVTCKNDPNGNIFLASQTTTTSNIATSGSHQSTLSGTQDVYLIKFNTSGIRQWGTYYGGTGEESYLASCSFDASNNIFLSGSTNSPTNIATAGSHQPALGGGYDAFLVKFSTSGVRQWGTYYGGTSADLYAVSSVDGSGNILFTGSTNSSTNIATAGSHQSATAGNFDAFLVKFNTNGVRQWGTYYGGSGDEIARMSCSVDAGGAIFIAGLTFSSNNIATAGAHQTIPGGGQDMFLVKFNASGIRQWGTYYGSGDQEYTPSVCVIDAIGNVALAGSSISLTNIATTGAHQTVSGGGQDAFVAMFNTSGVRQWATYCGGVGNEINTVVCAINGNIFLSGSTPSTTNIATAGSYQTTAGGGQDAFLVKFNASGVRQWGTYYGGFGNEDFISSSGDVNGNIFLAGFTNSTTNIANAGAHQTVLAGGYDAFLVKFTECVSAMGSMLGTIGSNNGNSACVGINKTYSLSQSVTNAAGYQWTVPAGVAIVSGQGTMNLTIATSTAGSPQLSVKAYGVCGDSSTAAVLTISSLAAPTINSISTTAGQLISGIRTVCNATTATFTTSGSAISSYTWTNPSGWTGTSSTASIILTAGMLSDTLVVTGLGSNGCPSLPQKLYVKSFQVPAIPGSIIGSDTSCVAKVNTFSVDSVHYATSYTWTIPSGWAFNSVPKTDSMVINPTPTGTIGNVTVVARNFCGASAVRVLPVTGSTTVPAQPSVITGLTAVCGNVSQTYSVTPVVGIKYRWTLPVGWVVQSGDSSSSITVLTGNSGGTISVFPYQASNPVCEGIAQTKSVSITATPNKPGVISGDTTICVSAANTYSIVAVSGATSYEWSLPSGWSGSSTTTSISATSTLATGIFTLKVKAVNASCSSLDTSLAISVSPAIGTVSVITGNTTMCANSSQKYSISVPNNATNYTWALPSGWAFSGKQDSIVINTVVGSSTGNVSVIASNKGCASAAKILPITTVTTAPSIPSTISGGSAACVGTAKTFFVTKVAGLTYTWQKGGIWTGSSDTSSIKLTSTAAGTDTIKVFATASGGCSSPTRTLVVTVAASPAAPIQILGPSVSCINSTELYRIPKGTDVNYYSWTYPSGWLGVISTTDSFVNVTVGNTSGPLSVVTVGNNGCSSVPRTSSSVAVSTVIPNPPATINGGLGYCTSVAKIFSVAAVSGATGYLWTIPTGWILNSGQNSTSINVTPNATPGSISVQTVQGGCKSGIQQSFIGNVRTKPAQPIINMANTSPCKGASINLDCSSVSDADTYTWTLPSGWSLSSANGSTFITAVVGSSGGNITVLPKNEGCDGTSAAKSATVSVSPTIAENITGETYVKSNVLRKYSITGVTAGQSYLWQTSPGWNIVGSNSLDSVLVFTGNTTGILTVTVSNTCGSTNKSKQIFAGLSSGVDEESLFEGMHLYPVPAKDVITLAFSLHKQTELEWRILNMLGQEVLAGKTGMIPGSGEQELPIIISTLPVGMYQLSIGNESQQKFIKFSTIK